MDDELRERFAVFRHGVIRDLVAGPLAPGEKERLLAEITEREWTIPGTSRRRVGRSTARDWMTLYERHGFEGLKPARRGDVGSSRTIPPEVQEMLLELRKARPTASTDSLIRAVELALGDLVRRSPWRAARSIASWPPTRRGNARRAAASRTPGPSPTSMPAIFGSPT